MRTDINSIKQELEVKCLSAFSQLLNTPIAVGTYEPTEVKGTWFKYQCEHQHL